MLPPAAWMSCTCSRMVVPLNSVSSSIDARALPADAFVGGEHERQGEVRDARRRGDAREVGGVRHRHVDVGREHVPVVARRRGERGVHRDRAGLRRRSRGVDRRHREVIVGVGREAGDAVAGARGRGDLVAVDEDRIAGDEAAARHAGGLPAQHGRGAGHGAGDQRRRHGGNRVRHVVLAQAMDMDGRRVVGARRHEAEAGLAVVRQACRSTWPVRSRSRWRRATGSWRSRCR